MVDNLQERANTLVEVFPYIKKFHGKTIVVKCGGEVTASGNTIKNLAIDLALMKYVGIKPVVVHGGGPQVNKLMEKLGKKAEFSQGMRKTDGETLEIVEMVLGKVNKDLVSLINQAGGNAVGLCGKDGGLIKARKLRGPEGKDLGMVGEVKYIDPSILKVLDEKGFIPVIAPLGVAEKGDTLNINADTTAAEIAISLKAEKLVFLTDKPGILKDLNNESSLISTLNFSQVDSYIKNGTIQGGMLPKVKAAQKVLKEGVNKTHIINGVAPHYLLLEIFTEKGVGTEIVK